jgi:hypothetical protein
MGDVTVGFSAFAGLVGMARGLRDLNDAVVRNDAVYALTEKALDLQKDCTALAQTVGELQAKLARFETWESDKQRYELKDHGNGVLAYALKDGVQPPEHPHSACPDCYQRRKRSILQTESYEIGRAQVLVCQICGWQGFIRGHAAGSGGRRRGR